MTHLRKIPGTGTSRFLELTNFRSPSVCQSLQGKSISWKSEGHIPLKNRQISASNFAAANYYNS